MADSSDGKRKKKSKKKGKKSKGKMLIAIIGGVLFLLAAGGGLSYYMGWIHAAMGWQQSKSRAEIELGTPVYHPLPEIRTDMKTGDCRAPFLRAVVHVQLFPEDIPRLQEAEAEVMDAVLTHLRDQERQHVVGKAGSERLRFELVQIIENVIKPAKVHTVLFKELIVQ